MAAMGSSTAEASPVVNPLKVLPGSFLPLELVKLKPECWLHEINRGFVSVKKPQFGCVLSLILIDEEGLLVEIFGELSSGRPTINAVLPAYPLSVVGQTATATIKDIEYLMALSKYCRRTCMLTVFSVLVIIEQEGPEVSSQLEEPSCRIGTDVEIQLVWVQDF
ncbi:hypothetical protein Tsubulata_000772 [Turnera subulata]|uniref:Uncharacterized protein n=1 Tax=Turnera subulata TaxID=218843 RepID=A0A9Q0JMD9_9ROSI|nr:hypothetical protein Tsubulata_000772 [Turnera subulata]